MGPAASGNGTRQSHAPENGCQVIDPEWLGKIPVEFGVLYRLFMLRKSIGRYCNNARVGRLSGLLPDAATGLEAIHFRHVQIHQDDLEIAVAIVLDGLGQMRFPRLRQRRTTDEPGHNGDREKPLIGVPAAAPVRPSGTRSGQPIESRSASVFRR